MRLDTHTARLFVVNQMEQARIVKNIRFEDEDCVFVDLKNGQSVVVHLYGRHLPMPELFDIFAVDSKMKAHTLPLLLCHWIIPENGHEYEPPAWIDALHTLFGNRIYTYDVDGPDTFIYPVTFDRQRNKTERLVRYGAAIKNLNLDCATVKFTDPMLAGVWRIAHFQDVPFFEPAKEEIKTPLKPTINPALLPYYRLLDLEISADWETVKKQYRQLARKYHPDINKSRQATELMQAINEAYGKISAQFEING